MFRKINKASLESQIPLPLGILQPPPSWRPIHYLGSKLRLVESIKEHLATLDPSLGTVCDLFAGSGTVSMALASERDVVAVDIQEYSRILCSALLLPSALEDSSVEQVLRTSESYRKRLQVLIEPILEFEDNAMTHASTDAKGLCDIVDRGSLLYLSDGIDDALSSAIRESALRIEKYQKSLMITRYFGGLYFSYRQTLFIDCILNALDERNPEYREIYIAALLSTASSIVNSVGKQFAQPIRPRRKDGTIKHHLISQMCRDRCRDPREVFTSWLTRYRAVYKSGSHRVMRGDYRHILPQLSDVQVIYADPPYTRDHYSRFYHVLETLCLRDCPDLSTTSLSGEGSLSRGFYRTDRHQSPFCIKSQAPLAFEELFAGAKALGIPILLSYSPYIVSGHPRLMTIKAVTDLAKRHYRNVEIVPAGSIVHSKLNKSELHRNVSTNAEVFILCKD